MTKIRLLVLIVASAAAFGSITEQVDAQKTPLYRPLKKINRYLGHWPNHGYHWRTPGPDVSYYNPYNAHNSRLIGQNYSSKLTRNVLGDYGNGGYQSAYGGGFGYDTGFNSYNQNAYGAQPQYSQPTPTTTNNNNDDSGNYNVDEPAARPVDSSIEGEVEIEPLKDADSLTPGDGDSTYIPNGSPVEPSILPSVTPAESPIIPSSTPTDRVPDPYWDNQTSSLVPLNQPVRN